MVEGLRRSAVQGRPIVAACAGLGDLELENMPTFSRRAPAPFVTEVADVADAGGNA
jgi:hypothetical protein